MLESEQIESLARSLKLTPYQLYMLQQNGYKYNLNKLVKRGALLYAPYKCELARNWSDGVAKIFLGSRADLIGSDRILVYDQRGIRLYNSGHYRAVDGYGNHYYADQDGNLVNSVYLTERSR
ncbi:MAG: hypothetical protein FWE50_03280 [Alphaproteobacteria bacterium]|nr:hypothetical protein [Alphaproteobacteria bacterium]